MTAEQFVLLIGIGIILAQIAKLYIIFSAKNNEDKTNLIK
jgi:hypothetical protein